MNFEERINEVFSSRASFNPRSSFPRTRESRVKWDGIGSATLDSRVRGNDDIDVSFIHFLHFLSNRTSPGTN
jgi:hypothetical protein